MSVEQACRAMIERRRWMDPVRNCEVWISAVEIRGSVELSWGNPDRPNACWVWASELEKHGVKA